MPGTSGFSDHAAEAMLKNLTLPLRQCNVIALRCQNLRSSKRAIRVTNIGDKMGEERCAMKRKIRPKKVRRSVALPRELVEEVRKLAPRELRDNLNRLVTVALAEFVSRRKADIFEEAMAQMAADPAIRAESAVISTEFAATEADGLKDD